jgi:hypothetical protein
LSARFLLFNTEKNSFAPHFQLEREERNKEFISSRNKSTEKEADEKEKQQKSVKMSLKISSKTKRRLISAIFSFILFLFTRFWRPYFSASG